MKICFFSGDISRTGGTERVSLIIANELAQRGYDISFLSYSGGECASFYKKESIKLYSIHMENVNGFLQRKLEPYIRLLRFIKSNKPDVLINIDVLLCFYSLPITKLCGIKNIAWEHFNFKSNNGVKNRDRARKIAAKFADQIVVLTKADLEEYKRNLRIHKQIDYIYNPSVGSNYGCLCDNKEKIIIASGRLTYQKNFHELLEIWSKVEPNHPDWSLFICGSGEEENKLKEFANTSGLKNVIFTGFVSNIESLYKKAQIMVMTSIYEGFPMVLLEGQKAGLPIVAYDCFTGPSEIIINGHDGYLIDQDDRDSFVSNLERLMNDEAKRKEFSLNAYEDSNRFNVEIIVDEWERLLNRE